MISEANERKKIMDLEHLNKKWRVKTKRHNMACIETDEDNPWFVLQVTRGLPGDPYGTTTAMRIAELHNEVLRVVK